jgi:hypothetical protein
MYTLTTQSEVFLCCDKFPAILIFILKFVMTRDRDPWNTTPHLCSRLHISHNSLNSYVSFVHFFCCLGNFEVYWPKNQGILFAIKSWQLTHYAIYTPFNALFTPLFVVSNGEKNALFRPQRLFLFEKCC